MPPSSVWLRFRAPRIATLCLDHARGSEFVPSNACFVVHVERACVPRRIAAGMQWRAQSNMRARLHIFYYFGVWDLPTTKSFATEKRRRAHAAIVDLNYRSSPRLTFALALPCSLTPRPLSPSRRARRRASSAPLIVPRRDLVVRATRACARGGGGGMGHGPRGVAARTTVRCNINLPRNS